MIAGISHKTVAFIDRYADLVRKSEPGVAELYAREYGSTSPWAAQCALDLDEQGDAIAQMALLSPDAVRRAAVAIAHGQREALRWSADAVSPSPGPSLCGGF